MLEGGAAQTAGLSAGDVVVALDGLRVTSRNLDKQLEGFNAGDRCVLHAFRRDELIQCEVVLHGTPSDTCFLTVAGNAAQRRRRQAWLGVALVRCQPSFREAREPR